MRIGGDTGAMKFGRFAKGGRPDSGGGRTAFRQTKAWKEFRAAMIAMNANTCEMCGMVYPGARAKMLQVHHLDPDNYETLDVQRFSVLCSSCHDLVERFVTRINGKAFRPPMNIVEWDALIGCHLSNQAAAKWRMILAGEYIEPEKPKATRKRKAK